MIIILLLKYFVQLVTVLIISEAFKHRHNTLL